MNPLNLHLIDPIVNIILFYLDINENNDLFDSNSRDLWLKAYNFKKDEVIIDDHFMMITTISIDGEPYLHSIDDRPCILIYNVSDIIYKLEKNPYLDKDELNLNVMHELKKMDVGNIHKRYEDSIKNRDLSTDHPLKFLVWAKFGIIHRDYNFAVFHSDGSDIDHYCFWVKNGVTIDPKDNYSYGLLFHGYSGHGQDCKIWLKPTEIKLRYQPKNDLNDFIQDCYICGYLCFDKFLGKYPLVYHREDGPAIINICRDPDEREMQLVEGGEYDSDCDPLSKTQWFLNGVPLSSVRHDQVMQMLKSENIDPLNYHPKAKI